MNALAELPASAPPIKRNVVDVLQKSLAKANQAADAIRADRVRRGARCDLVVTGLLVHVTVPTATEAECVQREMRGLGLFEVQSFGRRDAVGRFVSYRVMGRVY